MRKLFKFLLHKGKLNEETIWIFQGFTIPKKNSCRGNYMRKYGRYNEPCKFCSKVSTIFPHIVAAANILF